MALDNYSNFKATVIRLDGSNDLSDILDDCILLCETEMYNNSREPLRCRELETRTVTSTGTDDAFLALPTDLLSFRSIEIEQSGGFKELNYRSPEALQRLTTTGRPTQFTVIDQIEFNRTPDSDYTLNQVYFAKTTALDSTNSTNTVLTNYPNVYLFGTLWAVNLFNAEEEKSSYYYNLFLNAIRGANKRQESGTGPAPTMNIEGPTP
jgi:hypothetical protein